MSKIRSPKEDSFPQRPVLHIKNPLTPETISEIHRVMDSPFPLNGFRAWFTATGIEAEARQILDDADPPYDHKLVEARGFHEGSKEWYACEILRLSYIVQGLVGIGEAGYAVMHALELGRLFMEGDIWFDIKEQRRKGGQRPKNIPAVTAFVSSRLRKNPKLTSADIWKMIPGDECDGLKIGQATKIHIEKDILRVSQRRMNGDWEITAELTYRSFQRYVTNAKKTLTR